MDERTLESRLLELAFTTEAPITATALAFFAPCSVQEAGALLDRLATTGTLRIESDDEGNIHYELPNRARMAGPTAQALTKSPPTALGRPGVAHRPVQPSGPPLVNPVMSVGAPGVSPFAQTALAPIPKPDAIAPAPVTAGDLAALREAAAKDPSALVECPY